MASSVAPASRIRRVTITTITVLVALALTSSLRAQSSDAATSRSLVNSARGASGLGSLAGVSGLNQVAQAQAERMAARDAIYHNDNLKAEADAAGVNWMLIGENVGVGPDIQAVHDAFMASGGHRANIEHSGYNSIGTGVATGKDGSLFFAQVFADVQPKAEPKAASAPATQQPASAQTQVAANVESAPAAPVVTQAAQEPVVEPVSPLPNAVVGGIVNL